MSGDEVPYSPLPVLPQHQVFLPFDGSDTFFEEMLGVLHEQYELHFTPEPAVAVWENEGGALGW